MRVVAGHFPRIEESAVVVVPEGSSSSERYRPNKSGRAHKQSHLEDIAITLRRGNARMTDCPRGSENVRQNRTESRKAVPDPCARVAPSISCIMYDPTC